MKFLLTAFATALSNKIVEPLASQPTSIGSPQGLKLLGDSLQAASTLFLARLIAATLSCVGFLMAFTDTLRQLDAHRVVFLTFFLTGSLSLFFSAAVVFNRIRPAPAKLPNPKVLPENKQLRIVKPSAGELILLELKSEREAFFSRL